MTERILVCQCIDFRKIEQAKSVLKEKHGLDDGDYHLLATAGAARNTQVPTTCLSELQRFTWNTVINLNHQDCGYAKAEGDDSRKTHTQTMEQLGNTLRRVNPQLRYHFQLLPVQEGDLERHTCQAVAIILGTPQIIKEARIELDRLGFTNDHDEIARPLTLSVNDQSLWNDLDISLRLHHPSRIYIFEENENNANILVGKTRELTDGIQIQVKIVPLTV